MESNYINEEKYLMAQKIVNKIKGFYAHLIVYIIVNLSLALLNASYAGVDGFLNTLKTTGFFWGIGLAFHWYGVFGKNIIFGKKWEARKIKELMDQDKQKWV